MASRAQVYRSKLALSLAVSPGAQLRVRAKEFLGHASRASGLAAVVTRVGGQLPGVTGADAKKAGGLLKQASDLLTSVAHDLDSPPDMDMSFADLEGVDTVAMGKKAKADLKAVMTVVKQLAKLKPNSKWAEAEAFIQRALQNM